MPEKSWMLQKAAVAGLFFRVGKWSWFWGRGASPSFQRSEEVVPAQNPASTLEPWSNVAEWLRRMHARADLLPYDSANKEE